MRMTKPRPLEDLSGIIRLIFWTRRGNLFPLELLENCTLEVLELPEDTSINQI